MDLSNCSIGLHKLFILSPPTLDYVALNDLNELSRVGDTILCMRIFHPQGDCIRGVPISLSNKVITSKS